MIFDILFMIVGFIGLMYSADKFVDGASNLALNLKMPTILIGAVIVGIGTSAPEIIVSASAALKGSDLSLGNAIGSNISNIALIIGVTSLLVPLTVNRLFIKKEFMLLLGTTGLGMYLLTDGDLTRLDAIFFFIAFLFVMYHFVSNAKNAKVSQDDDIVLEMSLKKSILFTVGGMIALVAFSQLLVTGAVNFALALGIDEVIVGLTIVSIGTSLPELSACIAAARKKQADLAIGNIIGSNIFNILAVLSVSGAIYPMEVKPELIIRDIPLMAILTVGFLLVSFSPKGDGKINRVEGFVFLTIFVLYITSLILESLGIFNTTEFLTTINN